MPIITDANDQLVYLNMKLSFDLTIADSTDNKVEESTIHLVKTDTSCNRSLPISTMGMPYKELVIIFLIDSRSRVKN